jgi:hypothetical protein
LVSSSAVKNTSRLSVFLLELRLDENKSIEGLAGEGSVDIITVKKSYRVSAVEEKLVEEDELLKG